MKARVVASFDYPVVFTRGVFRPGNPALANALLRRNEPRVHRVYAVLDSGLAWHQPALPAALKRYIAARATRLELAALRVVPGGERTKNRWALAQRLAADMLRLRLDRHAVSLIVGGGAVLDAAGFAASLVHRGLRTVRVPATALAQADSGVGVKTAIDLGAAKNAIGTFAPPFAVVNDFDLLATLPAREWRGAAAEAFKVAIIRSRPFFEWLCRHGAAISGGDAPARAAMIRRCARLHLDHICRGRDPFELGRSKPLDFGHWAAHRLESLSGYRIRHGEAVAAGIALDSAYARLSGWLTVREWRAIVSGLRGCGLRLWYPQMAGRGPRGEWKLLAGLDEFREHMGGALCLTFPDGIGRRREAARVSARRMERAVRLLRAEAAC